MSTKERLLDAARDVRLNAHAPYSGFQVGAALRDETGAMHLGVNVENVAYPEGTCAEAGAIAAMVASGARQIMEIVVIADSPLPVTPCGGCRQKLAEFAGEAAVIHFATLDGIAGEMAIADLLPGAFQSDHLKAT